MPGKKSTVRGWRFPKEKRGWQQSDDFKRRYPTRSARREFYAERTELYQAMREGKCMLRLGSSHVFVWEKDSKEPSAKSPCWVDPND